VAEAVGHLRRAAELTPTVPEVHNNLGGLLALTGRHAEAAACFREAVRLRPDYAEAHDNLGLAAGDQDRPADAGRHHQAAARLRPDVPKFHHHLGDALHRLGRLTDAAQAQRRAIELQPDYPDALASLATTLGEQGRPADAADCLRRRAELLPRSPRAGSILLLALHAVEGLSAEAIWREHEAWAARHAGPLYPQTPGAFPNPPSPHRRLRVGYCSADLRDHPVARFFEPLVAHHDPGEFEVFCYSDVPPARRDATTARLAGYFHSWRDVHGLPDGAVADVVRGDRVDVLVDLAGHLNNPRLLLFARKPAPGQVTFLGYPDTTGLQSVDYRLTDALHDPPGQADRYHAERLVRLDPCAWCYRPYDHGVPVNDLPAARTGHITFGSLNRPSKATPGTLRLWAQVLAAVPGSRLVVLTAAGAEDDPGLLATFADHGIPADRLIRVGRRPRREYLRLYHDIDVHLDSHPYNGHTTTLDALWMGVPTVSLAGATHAARAGLRSDFRTPCFHDRAAAIFPCARRRAMRLAQMRQQASSLNACQCSPVRS
jgi:predicted O-linked N-acetylglucosamine transferase (SPINDLY family)